VNGPRWLPRRWENWFLVRPALRPRSLREALQRFGGPLTAVIDASRTNMLQGAGLSQLAFEVMWPAGEAVGETNPIFGPAAGLFVSA
jgi:hypothetical protein